MPVPGARPAQPAGSIQSPPQGMLGEAARIRAAGCAFPSPSNRGLKWVKEEGGGPGGLGEGAEELVKAPRGREPREDAWKSKTMCAVGLGGPGRVAERLQEDLRVVKLASELTAGQGRGCSFGLLPRLVLPFTPPLGLGGSVPSLFSLSQSPPSRFIQSSRLAQTRRCAQLGPSCPARRWALGMASRSVAQPIAGP